MAVVTYQGGCRSSKAGLVMIASYTVKNKNQAHKKGCPCWAAPKRRLVCFDQAAGSTDCGLRGSPRIRITMRIVDEKVNTAATSALKMPLLYHIVDCHQSLTVLVTCPTDSPATRCNNSCI